MRLISTTSYTWVFCALVPLFSRSFQEIDLNSLPDDTTKVNLLFERALDLRSTDSATAEHYANQMLILSDKLNFSRGKAKAHYVKGRIAHDFNSHLFAVRSFEKSITLYRSANDQFGIMNSHYWIARCYRRIADYPNYQKYLRLLEKLAEKLDNKEYLSYAYEGYGNLYRYLGDYPQSIDYYLKALQLSEELNNLEDISMTLNNMSLVYEYQGKMKEVLKLQLRNHHILARLGDKSDEVLCLSNLSSTYTKLGDMEKAHDYILQAMEIIDKIGEEKVAFKNLASAYGQYASMAIIEGDFERGLDYYSRTLVLREQNQDIKGISDSYGDLAFAYRSMGKYKDAYSYLQKQLDLSSEIGYVNGRINAYSALVDLEAEQGNFEEAYLFQKKHLLLKDSVAITTNASQVATLRKVNQQKHDIELLAKKKAMNDLQLRKRKAILLILSIGIFLILLGTVALFINYRKLKKAKGELQFINQELESFSYSISHDLRAPLRAIQGYSKLFLENHGSTLDEEAIRLQENIQHNSQKMSTLISDLLSFSKLGKTEISKQPLEMNELFAEALKELDTSRATIIVKELIPARGDFSLMYQVIINLLSNAIKYSATVDKPTVEISSERIGNDLIYTIKDNGVGFDMNYAHNLFGVFQRLHSPNEFEGTGIGLAIVHRIITKHGGTAWAEGKVNQGAVFGFSLPSH